MEKVFADKDYLMGLNLIIPIRTQDELSDPLEYNVADAVDSGVGLAGCHGGMCDAFRFNVEWQWMTGRNMGRAPWDQIHPPQFL